MAFSPEAIADKKIWLVGGSQGIGLQLSQKLLASGAQLLVSARQAEQSGELLDLQHNYPQQLTLMNHDVSQTEQQTDYAKQAWETMRGLDFWFYNVGSYEPMQHTQWDLNKFILMNQTNYVGCVALMCALKPYFLQQGHGTWIWNASIASDFGLPYGGGYSAPKAALVNLAESLQPELNTLGIELRIINHGFVKTRLTAKNTFTMPGLLEPEQAANKILPAFSKKTFETRFPTGLALFLGLLKRLPKRLALALTKKAL